LFFPDFGYYSGYKNEAGQFLAYKPNFQLIVYPKKPRKHYRHLDKPINSLKKLHQNSKPTLLEIRYGLLDSLKVEKHLSGTPPVK